MLQKQHAAYGASARPDAARPCMCGQARPPFSRARLRMLRKRHIRAPVGAQHAHAGHRAQTSMLRCAAWPGWGTEHRQARCAGCPGVAWQCLADDWHGGCMAKRHAL
jgi:hypothetical protein